MTTERGRAHLRKLIMAASDLELLDVSELNPDGTGPRYAYSSTENRVGDIPVVSDNYQNYKLAMDALGPEYAQYAEEYLNLYGDDSDDILRPILTEKARAHLYDLIVNAPRDEFLDVSNLGPGGSGTRYIGKPSPRSDKKGIDGLPVVSDNYQNYKLAIDALSPEFAVYADEYLKQYGDGLKQYGDGLNGLTNSISNHRLPEPTLTTESREHLLDYIVKADLKDQVVDVSHITPNGSGIRIIGKPSLRSDKKGINPLPIVSHNYEAYKLAIDILGPNYETFANQYYNRFIAPTFQSPSRIASPIRSQSPSRIASPSRSRSQIQTGSSRLSSPSRFASPPSRLSSPPRFASSPVSPPRFVSTPASPPRFASTPVSPPRFASVPIPTPQYSTVPIFPSQVPTMSSSLPRLPPVPSTQSSFVPNGIVGIHSRQ